MKIDHWNLLHEDYLLKKRWMKILRRRYRLPKENAEADFYIFEYSNWVNVIPLTEKNEAVLIRQFRPGLERVLWELPAGFVDKQETPIEAAKRELLEETGYSGGAWELVGTFSPNPGTHTNLSYSYLARGVQQVDKQKLDPTEDIEIILTSLNEVKSMLKRNEFMHSLHAIPLMLFFFGDQL